jgi:hypothetical protein
MALGRKVENSYPRGANFYAFFVLATPLLLSSLALLICTRSNGGRQWCCLENGGWLLKARDPLCGYVNGELP